ncbi:hypothetical protein Sango_1851300 [Sesamum angolense]|uniref:Pentatricopeptide repeat-containing protein n=1 Tax=Sesamum angolense TaxID=2727404 RepID=A0AAE1WI36_9LAMI|nr:hypothetical protein Sango_1851300 [Sesamum angolense]
MLFSTIRLVSRKKLSKNLQFIRLKSVPSLAHFTPYFSDSGSEDLSHSSGNDVIVTNCSNSSDDSSSLELNSYGKLDALFMEVINVKNGHLCFEVPELLEAMAEEFKADGPSSLLRAFDALIKGYVTLGMLTAHGKVDTAVAIYKQLRSLGLSPNVYTYGIVIKAYCRKGCLEEAVEVFLEMEEAGVAPNAFTYAAYLEGLCIQGRSDLGFEVLQAWRAKNVPVDAYAYTAVIQGFVSEKNLKKAEIVLLDMEEHGLVPEEANYRSLVQGYCDSGDIIKALAVHNEMEAKVSEPIV